MTVSYFIGPDVSPPRRGLAKENVLPALSLGTHAVGPHLPGSLRIDPFHV
jgi:hypothetical protein